MQRWASNIVSQLLNFFLHHLTNRLYYSFTYSATEEFDELCFQFGIELDDDVSRSVKLAKSSH